MLNFLSPPTDSFYKFIGIGGLALFIICAIFLFSTMYEDDHKLILANGNLQEQEYKLKGTIDDLEYLPEYQNLENVDISLLRAWSNNQGDSTYLRDQNFVQSFYALPDSVREKIKTILFSGLKYRYEYESLSQKINQRKEYQDFVFICCLIGEIFAFIGIYFWYDKIQKPLEEDRKSQESQKRFLGTNLSEYCHSCYMTFYFNNERGIEKDGTISRFFCKECYGEGKYTEPDLTFDEAKKRLVIKLHQLNYKPRRIKRKEKAFGNLLRWERLKTW